MNKNDQCKYMLRVTFDKLQQRLDYLKTQKLRQIVDEKASAYHEGNIDNNAGWEDALHEEGLVHAEIAEITARLSDAVIIDEMDIDTTCAGIGTVVDVLDLDTGETDSYAIVGYNEYERKNNHVEFASIGSPLAKVLLGKGENDTVEFSLPDDEMILYRTLKISRYFSDMN